MSERHVALTSDFPSFSRTVQINQESNPSQNIIRPDDKGFILEPLDKRCLPVSDPAKKMASMT